MTRIFFIIAAGLSLFFSGGSAHAERYEFVSQWGDQRADMSTQFDLARGVTVDSASNVYVSDTYHNRIFKHGPDGAILKTWSDCQGSPLALPMGMFIDRDNLLYVADMLNSRVAVFDLQGVCVGTIGTYGLDNQAFVRPIAVTGDTYGNIYISDRKAGKVVKYAKAGNTWTWTAAFGPDIAGYGTLNNLWGVAAEGDYLLVADALGEKVLKLDLNGNYITSWGGAGTGNGQFRLCGGIAVDKDKRVYVADTEHHRIQVFDFEGNFIRIIGERGTGDGQLQFPSSLAIDRNRNILYTSDDDNSRVMKFDISAANPGGYLGQWGNDSSGTTGLRYPTKIAFDKVTNAMYVVDSGNHRIIKLSADMQALTSWGGYGDGSGKFRFPIDVAVDSHGDVYVLDDARREVQRFDSSGTYLESWPVNFDQGLSYLYGLQAIYIDPLDNVYVIDADNLKTYKTDVHGNYLWSWNVDFYSTGLTGDDAGFLYVTSFNNPSDRVRKFDSSGISALSFLDAAGKAVSYFGPYFSGGTDRIFHPWDIAVVENGNLLVTDTFNNRVLKFDGAGNYLSKWGSTGGTFGPSSEPGKFSFPYGIAVDKDGFVFVADTGNHRIQKFVRVVFDDVPALYWARTFINRIYDQGITSGCSATSPVYCPEASVTRAQMAVFILKTLDEQPAAACTGAAFGDVNAGSTTDGFCRYIEKFASLGITSGCALDDPSTPGVNEAKFCPDGNVTRAQMAVFISRALNAVPAGLCSGASFNDVNAGSTTDGFCRYIEKFASLGITSGCASDDPSTPGVNEAKFCPDSDVLRSQMAVFLTKGFLK